MTSAQRETLRDFIVKELTKNPNLGLWDLTEKAQDKFEFLALEHPTKVYNAIYYQKNKIEASSADFVQTVGPAQPTGTMTYSTGTTVITPGYVSSIYTPPQPKAIVGIIADTHEPFCLPGYREFCQETFKKYGVTRVVHIGDEVDNYFLSYHEKNPNFLNAEKETERAMANLKEWYKAFPNVDILVGNHGALPFRKATTIGLPKKWLKTYEEYWDSPSGWKWHEEIVIDNVKYVHGVGSSGQTGAIDRAIRSRQSTVIGHIHAFAGVNYHASNNDLIFGMNVGCGIDHKAYAFEYGKDFNNKPVIGCGIVLDATTAIFVPMDLGSKYVKI